MGRPRCSVKGKHVPLAFRHPECGDLWGTESRILSLTLSVPNNTYDLRGLNKVTRTHTYNIFSGFSECHWFLGFLLFCFGFLVFSFLFLNGAISLGLRITQAELLSLF